MNQKPQKTLRFQSGFALITTILLLTLIAVIALGTLSLSAVALRSSSQDSAQARAQANARMALMLAIGELQKQMGPDQRISANSEILEPDSSAIRHRHWTGTWNSWKAGEGESSSGSAKSSQHSTIAGVSDDKSLMAPTYEPNRRDYFSKWLVSLDETEASSISSPIALNLQAADMPLESHDAVFLVSKGSLGDDDAVKPDYVAARLMDVKDADSSETTGRYGWWVGDESQKGRVMDDSYADRSLTLAEKISRAHAAASMGTKTIPGLENIEKDTQLGALPSLATLDLVTGAVGRPSQGNFHHVTPHSYQVLADVREGGMKRDLSTLLERQIKTNETADEFMLYRFGSDGEARVPIQDLAAYYQMYYNDPNWDVGRRGGMIYDPASSTQAFKVKVPNYGTRSAREKHLRQYTSLYTSPVPVKIQFILALGAVPITDADRDYIKNLIAAGDPRARFEVRPTDTHKLLLGVIPVISLWNPNNVPMVIEQGNMQAFKFNTPPFTFRFRKYRGSGGTYDNGYFNLNYTMASSSTADGRMSPSNPYLIQLKFAETNSVTFEPGEVKIFSVKSDAFGSLTKGIDGGFSPAGRVFEPVNAWDPYGFFPTYHAAIREFEDWRDVFDFSNDEGGINAYQGIGMRLVIDPTDSITLQIEPENCTPFNPRLRDNFGIRTSHGNEIKGGAFNCWLAGYEHVKNGTASRNDQTYHFRNYQMMSKFGPGAESSDFNKQLILPAFPEGKAIPLDSNTNAIPCSKIISATENGEVQAIMSFSMMAGCEVSAANVGGHAGGRKTASRPFLHGSTIAAPLIDQLDKSSLYNAGWEWQIDRINEVEEAIQLDPGTGNSYFGGGYTVEAGATRVVQQHLPVLPPMSIASLSNAHLGGFSIANQPVVLEAADNVFFERFGLAADPLRDARGSRPFQKVTACGAAGLAPHVMQSIGNSYAHPNIPADLAFTSYARKLSALQPAMDIPYVDHSYLANKALWDEFFFSSMTPQPASSVPIFDSNRTLAEVAREFFFDSKPLPNCRMVAYGNNLDEPKLDNLIGQADLYKEGLADKIAAHLMVEGSFNVNSTSVEAWKVFFSSLKGKPIARLDNGAVSEHKPDGVPANSGVLGNKALVKTANITDFNKPTEQWQAGRELTDNEIEELAKAMVKQVKLRGPFLSLSEFVNRRLATDSPLALKGALQAALDDPSVPINANFRTKKRILDEEVADNPTTPEVDPVIFAYPDAGKGPIAYGSSAYVDQADILGHFAEQLTPRGDTFVIRTYGDALDKSGKVIARAWCEAVVQRVPEYINSADDPHLKQADPALSEISKNFGRKIQITSFRWLNSEEI